MSMTSPSSALARPDSQRPSTARRKGWTPSSSRAWRPAARLAHRRRSKTISVSRPGSPARRWPVAQIQAQKFGARLAISRNVAGIDCSKQFYRIRLDDDQTISARVVIVATGARYRKLDVPNYAKFEGQGIHYAATAMEAQLCGGEEVIVVGGGNSAGQAAMFLSRTAAHVHVLVRASSLAATMSDYLVQRIRQSPKITLHARTEITALEGDDRLRQVTWTSRDTGESETRSIGNVFVMIGAEPNTDWLDGCLDLDAKGFIQTGKDADGTTLASPYATTRPYLRGRRRPLGVGQARRLRRWRGLGRDPGRASVPQPRRGLIWRTRTAFCRNSSPSSCC